jgi:hypothetical protein
MKCCFEDDVEATRCVVSAYGDDHFPLCPRHYDNVADSGGLLALVNDDGVRVWARDVVTCNNHFSANERTESVDGDLDREDDLDEEDEAVDVDADQDDLVETPRRRTTRGARKSKKKGAKKGASVKIDPAQALAFVRSRIASEKDPLTKAFYERELTTLQQTIKKAEAERRAHLSIPVNGGSAKIGTHVFEVTGLSWNATGKAVLAEYVVTSIFEQKETYGTTIHKVANLRRIHGKGEKRIKSVYDASSVFLNPRSCIDQKLNQAKSALSRAEHELERARKSHDSLVALREKAPEKAPEPTPIDKIANASKATSKAPRSGRVAAKAASGGARSGKRWTDEENATLKARVTEGKSPEDIAEELGRPRDRVVRQMHKLGVKPASTPFKNFRAERNGDPVHENQMGLLPQNAQPEAVPA